MAPLLLALAGLGGLAAAGLLVVRVRRQIREMVEILEEIQAGNHNRRILAPPGRLTAPLAYAINRLVQDQEEERQRFRRAEEADRQLMAGLSHDIRTPLTTLIGYLDAIHRQVVTGAEREQYLEIARGKAHRLKETTDALFTWFKLYAGEEPLQTSVLDLGELTRSILVDWVPLLEEGQIAYEVEIPEEPFWVLLDPEGYRRILNNLLQNILVHSRATRVVLSMTGPADTVTVRLADNGVGIAADDLAHIFDRLYKCDPARTSVGSGLGLAIARQLAEAMGGGITAESSPGQGTSFILTFPRRRAAEFQGKHKVAVRPV